MSGEDVARHLLAGREPHAGQALHALDQAVEHGDAQRPARDEGMHADIEVAALLVLLQEGRPPDLLDMLGIHHALRVVLGVEPGEAEEHRVVDGVVERQVQERLRAVGLADVVRAMVGRVVRVVDVALLEQELAGVPAPRAHGALAGQLLDRVLRPAQVLALQHGILGDLVLPHVIGDLVAALGRRLHRLRVELADAAGREDRGLDGVAVEQLDQAPDADAAAELALGELHRRLVQHAAQQHGVEIRGEVHRDARALRPGAFLDDAMARAVVGGLGLERCDIAVESVGEFGRGVHV